MATATKEVTFVSGKYPNLDLVKQPEVWEKNHAGVIVATEPSVRATFGEGGNDPGYFRTSDPELIEWLRGHPLNGAKFIEEGADEPQPTVRDQVARIQDAAKAGDEDEIYATLQLEEETHNRTAVLDVGKASLMALSAKEEGDTS
jgi:hypothetical protein